MFPDIYVYCVHLPAGVKEMVTPCLDGYTVYINDVLDRSAQVEAYRHAVRHIMNNDFEKQSVQRIEAYAHRLNKIPPTLLEQK